jgi:hypothetical protein
LLMLSDADPLLGSCRPFFALTIGGRMLSAHMPKRLAQVSRSFEGTDPKAWWVLLVAVVSLAVFLYFVFSR